MLTALPTAVAPDGTPVAPYLVLPARDEADLIHSALRAGSQILELGCGAGRVSRALVDLGHRVTAVDQSSAMLAHVEKRPNLTVLRADIEALALERMFGGVVLASYLVNVVDREQRSSFLSTCRRHVADDGVVVIQRIDPEVHWTPGAESFFGPVHVQLVAAEVVDRVLRAQIEYRIEGRAFPQAIVAEILDDQTLRSELAAADLFLDRFLDAQRTWLVARLSRRRA